MEYPKTHDIARLLDLVKSVSPLELSEAVDLTPYGTAYPYRGDYPEVSLDEAKRCPSIAQTVSDRLPRLETTCL